MRPDLSRVGPPFHNYINQVTEDELMEAFSSQSTAFIRFLETIPADKYDYRYAEGKWSIKEVLQHIIDAERVFAYRALRFARKDTTPLDITVKVYHHFSAKFTTRREFIAADVS